jgi:hypothetical protein
VILSGTSSKKVQGRTKINKNAVRIMEELTLLKSLFEKMKKVNNENFYMC